VAPDYPISHLTHRAVFGHRGNRAHSPENTIHSMLEAVALGAHGLEFDVRVTRDGEVVVIHDDTVDRTTNGSGAIDGLTWAEVQQLDAGARFTRDGGATFPFRARGIGVPRLRDVLDAVPRVPLLMEIKTRAASLPVRQILLERDPTGRCTVAAFDGAILEPFRGTRVPRAASTADMVRMYIPALLGRRHHELPFAVMSLPRQYRGVPVPLGALARSAAPAGVPLLSWTINDARIAQRLFDRGVRGVISDDPGQLLAALGQAAAGGP
jgi:glycerophosphoryl diester phosphodiesterase